MGREIDGEKQHEGVGRPNPAEDELSSAWDKPVTHCLLPAFTAARRGRDTTAARIALARWGLAIGVYRQRTGHLPETLRDVEESAGWRLPADPFTGRDLHYHRTDGGYLMYSLGANRQDDQGQNWADKAHRASGPVLQSQDDIAWWFN